MSKLKADFTSAIIPPASLPGKGTANLPVRFTVGGHKPPLGK